MESRQSMMGPGIKRLNLVKLLSLTSSAHQGNQWHQQTIHHESQTLFDNVVYFQSRGNNFGS